MRIIAAFKLLLALTLSVPINSVAQGNFTPAHYVIDNVLQVPYLRTDYFPELLKLALDKTVDSHGPYHMYEQPWIGPKQRMRQFLADGRYIRVLWSTTSKKTRTTTQSDKI
ncbi:hypothetical protein [Catenovulum agarivorans]|uniref:hypothetical protein n=1 Tax=Catenovulum agarivorans TaxID=1172192 RepID=UPI00145C6F2E|nr:hypothetical protein [Catenovulum agarivorans]